MAKRKASAKQITTTPHQTTFASAIEQIVTGANAYWKFWRVFTATVAAEAYDDLRPQLLDLLDQLRLCEVDDSQLTDIEIEAKDRIYEFMGDIKDVEKDAFDENNWRDLAATLSIWNAATAHVDDDFAKRIGAKIRIRNEQHTTSVGDVTTPVSPTDPKPTGVRQSKWAHAADPVPDGLHHPNTLVWNGKEIQVQPLPFKLLNLLWSRKPVRCGTAVDLLWGVDSESFNKSERNLKDPITKANAALLEVSFPGAIRTKSGYVQLS